MSVRLENVTKTVSEKGRPRVLFDRINLEIGRAARVGVLALPKSGKTTLLRIICGIERPDSGRIDRETKTSWLIPSGEFLVPSSSIAWNLRSLARIYGVKDRNFVERIGQLSGLQKYLNTPWSQCPPALRNQLTFAVGIGMDFQLYLFDNQLVPPRKEFKEIALEHLRARTEGKSVFVATSAPAAIADFCESIYVLEQGRVTHFPEAKAAVEHFKAMQKAEAERQKELQERQNSGENDQGPASGEEDAALDVVAAATLSDPEL
jgi:capsular polysaccharide transport system ATP-binding protein